MKLVVQHGRRHAARAALKRDPNRPARAVRFDRSFSLLVISWTVKIWSVLMWCSGLVPAWTAYFRDVEQLECYTDEKLDTIATQICCRVTNCANWLNDRLNDDIGFLLLLKWEETKIIWLFTREKASFGIFLKQTNIKLWLKYEQNKHGFSLRLGFEFHCLG